MAPIMVFSGTHFFEIMQGHNFLLWISFASQKDEIGSIGQYTTKGTFLAKTL